MRLVSKSWIYLLWLIFTLATSSPHSVLRRSMIWWVWVMTHGRPFVMLPNPYFWKTLLLPMMPICKRLHWCANVTPLYIYLRLSVTIQIFIRPFIMRQMSELCLEEKITHWCLIGSTFRLGITGEHQVSWCQVLRSGDRMDKPCQLMVI